MGLDPGETVKALLQLSDLTGRVSPEEFMSPYDIEVVARLQQQSQLLPGIREAVRSLRQGRVPLGLASSSRMSWIEATLRAVTMGDAFQAVVSGTEVEHPKPAPDVYLAAAAKIGVPPESCIAIEDSANGVRSASAAGLYIVQLRASSTAFPPQPEADLVVDRMADVDFTSLLQPSRHAT
jgi:HAD superfamily hydrolase (TIGR01509 family)